MSRLISLAVLLAFIVLIGLLFYKVMIGFVVPVFLAAVLVVVFRPLHHYVLSRVGHREKTAAAVTTLLVILIVLVPAGFVLGTAAIQATKLVSNFNTTRVNVALAKTRRNLNLELEYEPRIRTIQAELGAIQNESDQWNSATSFSVITDTKGQFASLTRRLLNEVSQLEQDVANASGIRGTVPSDNMPTREPADTTRTSQSNQNSQATPEQPTSNEDASLTSEQQIDNGQTREIAQETRLEFQPLRNAVAALIPPFSSPTEPSKSDELSETAPDGPASNAKGTPETANDDKVDILEIQSRIVQLTEVWQQRKEALLGGPTRAFLKELANPSKEQVDSLTGNFLKYIQPKIVSLTGATGAVVIQLLVGIGIMMVALYFFLYDGPSMVKTLMRLSPLDDRYELELLSEFERTSRAVVLATIFSAIVQGLVAGIGYYFAGAEPLIFLTLLTAVCALIPFVGPALVWVPVCLWIGLYEENIVAAGLLAAWGTIVVGSSDNLVKAFILHGQSSLHPFLALLSVLGGVQSLGPIGILVGPMAVTLLQTLLGMLQTEMNHFDSSEQDSPDANLTVGAAIASAWRTKRQPTESARDSNTRDANAQTSGETTNKPATPLAQDSVANKISKDLVHSDSENIDDASNSKTQNDSPKSNSTRENPNEQ